MNRSVKVAGCLAAGMTAVGLFGAPLAMASPEDDFIGALDDEGVTWPGATPDNMLAAGQGVCQDWDSGATFEQELDSLAGHLGVHNSAFLIGAATAAFCPQYESKLQ